jgi:hypothetical protein
MAMAMAMAGMQKNGFWREPRHKGGYCCFEWAVCALWACYMSLRALYNPKPPIWPLIGLPELAGEKKNHGALNIYIPPKKMDLSQIIILSKALLCIEGWLVSVFLRHQ